MKTISTVFIAIFCITIIQAQKPNLVFGRQSSKVVIDQKLITYSMEVLNLGKTDASYSYLGYYLSSDKEISTNDIYLGYDYVSSLKFKESSKESFTINLSNRTDIPDGTYYVGALIDYTTRVAESQETDNGFIFLDEKIDVNNSANLIIAPNSDAVNIDGQTISFDLEVKNTGGISAPYSYLGYYLSPDLNFTTDDIYLGYDYVTSLNNGEFSNEAFSINISNRTGIEDGSYYIGVIVDYTERVQESNEDDNIVYWLDKIIRVDSKTDLTFKYTDNLLQINGTSIQLNASVVNPTNSNAAYSYLGYYLSQDSEISTDDYYLGYDYVTALEPGEMSEEQHLVDIANMDLQPGEYFIGMIIDYTERLDEKDEVNNTYRFEEKININAARNLSYQVIDFFVQGNNIEVDLVIRNTGDLQTDYAYLGHYLSSNPSIDINDHFLDQSFIAPLNPGETIPISFIINLADFESISDGSYYYGFIVDFTNRVEENNENDNIYMPSDLIYKQTTANNEEECSCTDYEAASFCDDFQSYNLGAIGPQSNCWTTFSGNEGNGEDALVRRNNAGNQYLRIHTANNIKQDVILKLGDRTSGKFELKFKIYIPEGKKGYYGIMHQYIAGGEDNDQFAQDIVFEGNGTARLRVNNSWYYFNYEVNSWIDIKQQFDLDNNQTKLFIQGDLYAYWPFTLFNKGGNGLNKLSAVNFYAFNQDYIFYIDDLEFMSVVDFNEASGLVTSQNHEGNQKLSTNSAFQPLNFADIGSAPKNNTLSAYKWEEQRNTENFFNFPNPTNGLLTTSITLSEHKTVQLELLDANGRVLEILIRDSSRLVRHSFDLSLYEAGTYFVRATLDGQITTRTVVKVD